MRHKKYSDGRNSRMNMRISLLLSKAMPKAWTMRGVSDSVGNKDVNFKNLSPELQIQLKPTSTCLERRRLQRFTLSLSVKSAATRMIKELTSGQTDGYAAPKVTKEDAVNRDKPTFILLSVYSSTYTV